jgi:signal transduction histidine kinase
MSARMVYRNNYTILVKDTGVGIDENEIKDLFSAFKKISNNRSMNMQGCGLGLTFCKTLTKVLGGTISATSIKG